jgi:hypothetical protein
MITFEQAREAVTHSDDVRALYPRDDFQVADYGWQDQDDFMVVAGTGADVDGTDDDFDSVTMDAPVLLVSKNNGNVRMLTGTMGQYPTDAMTAIGDAPEAAGDD